MLQCAAEGRIDDDHRRRRISQTRELMSCTYICSMMPCGLISRSKASRTASNSSADSVMSNGDFGRLMRNCGRRRPRLIRSSSTARQASVVSPPMFLIASRIFWPSSRTPITTSSEIDVAFRSSRTRATVPSRIEDQARNRLFGERTGVPGIPVTLHLSPYPPHRVLAYGAAEQRLQRAADPARVDAGQVAARDQCVSCKGAALIGERLITLSSPQHHNQTCIQITQVLDP